MSILIAQVYGGGKRKKRGNKYFELKKSCIYIYIYIYKKTEKHKYTSVRGEEFWQS